jgi:thiol-disulfide isomerase/thioredoxin
MLLLLGCVHAPPSVAGAPPRAGASTSGAGSAPGPEGADPVPRIDADGLAELLQDPGTGPLVVNFWATWCGPCVAELADLRDVAEEEPGVAFALVSVDDPRDHERAVELLAEEGIRLPAWHLTVPDPSRTLATLVPAWRDIIPVTLVLEPGGALRARFDGRLDVAALRDALRDDDP